LAVEEQIDDFSGTALIVDNEPQALAALRLLLESWHWRVLATSNAQEALAMARTEPLDLAVLDYHLDESYTGIALHHELRDSIGDIRTVILTADRDSALRRRIRAEGTILLYKPLKPLKLRQVLRHTRIASTARGDAEEMG
jgi:CheY-like chemotaxis protein